MLTFRISIRLVSEARCHFTKTFTLDCLNIISALSGPEFHLSKLELVSAVVNIFRYPK